MDSQVRLIAACVVLLTISGIAQSQSTVTTTGGTANSVPKFSGNTTLVSSAITELNGDVGIQTTSPQAALHIAGENNVMRLDHFGILDNPNTWLTQNAYYDGSWHRLSDGNPVVGMHFDDSTGNIVFVTDTTRTGIPDPLSVVTILNAGNVGIGTTAPGSKLEVNGNVKLTSGSGASITFADGTVQSTAWTGSLCGGDYAETVNASGDHKNYEPGDVLVLSDEAESDVSKSSQPYSTLVAGIYSTKPGLVGRRQTGEKSDAELPMAMVGIVPTKVSAENGAIHKGDLLVTSSTEGHAMKGTDPSRMLGAIVGKAMGTLDSGTGVIEVLVSLQ